MGFQEIQARIAADTGIAPFDQTGPGARYLHGILMEREHVERRLRGNIADLRDHLAKVEQRVGETGALRGIGPHNIHASGVTAAIGEIQALDMAYAAMVKMVMEKAGAAR